MLRWSVRRSLYLLGAAVLAAVGVGAGSGAAARAAVVLRVSGQPLNVRPVAHSFLGLSLEYRSIPGLVGSGAPVNTVFLQLLHGLDPDGRPELRIGGQSADRTWWPLAGVARPPGITYNLSPSWIARMQALDQATQARLILGLGLEADVPRIDAVEAQQLLNGLGSQYIEALEIGNEPELYPVIPWYHQSGHSILPWYSHVGSPVYSRPSSYGPKEFAAEFSRIMRALPKLPIAGTGGLPFLTALRPFVSATSQLRVLSWHDYGLNGCVTDPASPQYPTVRNLLAPAAAHAGVAGIGPFVALAHHNGAGFRVAEMGSISCNGRAGVSNTFASALWVMDALFAIAADGVDGVDLHTYPNSVNGLFDFVNTNGQWLGTVYPLYYGALMFEQAAPAGSRLVAIAPAGPAELREWATLAPDRRLRVLLINDSFSRTDRVSVRVPRGYAAASLERLLAPSAYATSGVTLGGQGFSAQTATGVLAPPHTSAVPGGPGGYAITLPPASAALLTLTPPGPGAIYARARR
jgi:hypothetical protein